ncbi:MAG: RCC1 repeat-containing protein [Actinomycetota bacterium]
MWSVRRRGVALIATLLIAIAMSFVAPPAGAASPGTVYTWGDNALGQLGDGGTAGRSTPASIGLSNVTGVSGGRDHALALLADGTVRAWGHNNFGQVGDGTTTNRRMPTLVAGLSSVVEVAAGHYHSMALRSDGTVWDWGQNVNGQLGDGTTTVRRTPVQVVGLTGVAHIAGGRDMSYALKTDGTVWAWGLNSDGELGDGTTSTRTTPVRVGSLTGITEIAGGRDHGLALRSDGTVWSWGDNAYGELGVGSGADRPNPVQIGALAGVVSLTAGAFHSIALLSDGTVRAWGRNNLGQLGDNTTTNRSTPVSVQGLTSVAAVGSGRDHSLAAMADGTARAWGRNDFGQLGDTTTTNRMAPVVIAGLSGVIDLSGGQGYTVALAAPGPPDTTPPTQPGKPSGSSNTPGSIALAWAASSDDTSTQITYQVFRDGGLAGTVMSASTTTVGFTDTGLAPSSTHTYTVVARDAADNPSTPSDPSDPITVLAGPPVLFADDFSSGNLSLWTTVTRLTIDPAVGDPAPSAKAQGPMSSFAMKTLASPATTICESAHVNLTDRGTNTVALLRLVTAGNIGIVRLFVNTSGVLVAKADAPGTTKTSGVALGSGWISLELCGAVTGATGVWDVYRNGTHIISAWATAAPNALIAAVQIGDTTAKTMTVNFDDVIVDQQAG